MCIRDRSSTVQSKCCKSAQVKCVPTTTWQQNSDYLNDELQQKHVVTVSVWWHSVSVMTQYQCDDTVSLWQCDDTVLSIIIWTHQLYSSHNTAADCWVIYALCPKTKRPKYFSQYPTKLGQLRWNLVHSFLNKFATKSRKCFPPHQNNVSTLSCETWNAILRTCYSWVIS